MFCPNCGKKITTQGKFCIECGASLPQQESAAVNGITTEEKVKTSSEKTTSGISQDTGVPATLPQGKSQNGLKNWIDANPLRAVLTLIGILFGVFIITILIITGLKISHERTAESGYYDKNYGYSDDAYYNEGNMQWYNGNQWESDFEDSVDDIGATIPQGYTVSYGKMLRHCFHNGSWSYNSNGGNEDSMTISYLGACIYQGSIADAEVFFVENEEDVYEISTVVINGKTLTAQEISAFVADQYQKYQEDKGTETPQS